MPTIDRRPRARRRPDAAPDDDLTILRAMHSAGGDAVAWAALRPRAIRCFSQKTKPADAAQVFDAYARASQRSPGLFLPMLPPPGANGLTPTASERNLHSLR